MNSVSNLQKHKFSGLTHQDKIKIKELGRPIPQINIEIEGSKESGIEDPGVFRGLINFSADLDNVFREHLQTATIFKGTSKDIQNELLQCMLDVCREKIVSEINQANYLAVMAYETSDVSSKFQMAVVLRYMKGGTPVEKFWGFILPAKHDAASQLKKQTARGLCDGTLDLMKL
ncbi:hypothetical protein NQ315_008299 [Exocentrus adspersus]|uniref:DUF4371 domain-containing protein n=1 Tax=Exocentrus adspersus TaxID=1586481 RepID=A0AAV8VNQ3_9CUCU|nr:hypothetical protein NQ315_008299 [Exocentrus adspersus]